MNQSKFVAILCNLHKAREKSRVQVAIGFGFPSHWLINWRDIFKPITKRANCIRIITFDSHFKTALAPASRNSVFRVFNNALCFLPTYILKTSYNVRVLADYPFVASLNQVGYFLGVIRDCFSFVC